MLLQRSTVTDMATTSNRLRLVAYLRVSTDAQVADGFGLQVQAEAVAAWAKANGHRIVRTCSDEAVSGTIDCFDRDGFACAIDAIESGAADALLIPRLDRLARQLTIQEAVLAHIWQRGGRVFTTDGGEVLPDDADDPARTAMRQMAGVFAQLDRAMIAKRLRDGRKAKASKGGYVAGSPPYGFRAEHGELVPDSDEQAVLDRMKRMREAGSSLRDIAAALNADGISSKRGATWSPSTISRILDDTARERARQRTEVARRR